MSVDLSRWAAVLAVVLAGPTLAAGSAWGDEPGETDIGYVLVQQALAHLVHDSSSEGIDVALEKVADALETDNNAGVDLRELKRGEAALRAGRVSRARELLQESVSRALKDRPTATGIDPGTTAIRPELPGRTGFRDEDWGFLVAALLALGTGSWLSIRFRPRASVRTMRRQLAGAEDDRRS